MLPITKEILGADRSRQKECKDVLVCLLDITGRAGEDEVVATVVSALAFTRRDVIERDPLRTDATAAVRAHGSVPGEQPLARVGVGVPARRKRGVLLYGSAGTLWALARTTWFSTWTH